MSQIEIQKELLKSRIKTVLENMKEKYVSEKDFKKAYHAEYNQNINVMLDEVCSCAPDPFVFFDLRIFFL